MLFVPESPRFLLQNKQTESARKALSWFRNSNEEEVEEELAEVTYMIDFLQDIQLIFSTNKFFMAAGSKRN